MAKSFSFDITSSFDISELDHAIDQAKREMINRYDFKGSSAAIKYIDEKKTGLKIEGDSEYQIDAVLDMIRGKLAKRNLSQKILDVSGVRQQAGMILRLEVPFISGLDQEKAKKISKLIREDLPKLKPQIQGEIVRVTGPSKDDLQKAMQIIKEADFDFPIQFENYR